MSIIEQAPLKALTTTTELRDGETDRIPGAAAGALVANGAGCTAFVVAVVAAEAGESIKTALTLSEGVGPLSGKAAVATVEFQLWAAG